MSIQEEAGPSCIELEELPALTGTSDPVFSELWYDEMDEAYDRVSPRGTETVDK